jgi:hypothetical protein
VSTDVFAEAVTPGSPALSGDLVLTEVAAVLAGHPLAADLVGILGDGQGASQRPLFPAPLLGLVRAAVAGDARSFAAAAASVTEAVVTVIDGDGTVLASSAKPGRLRSDTAWMPADGSRDILLRDESGLRGAIRLMSGPPGQAHADSLLRDLGLALVTSIDSERRRRTLESQLVVLSCLAGSDTGRLFRRDLAAAPDTPRRLVVIRAAAAIEGHAGTQLLDAAIRAAARTEVLPGLCMVMSSGSLLGVYSGTDPRLARHKRCWSEVLRVLADSGPLTVAVGAVVSDIGDFPGQHRMLREIAKIQQSESRYFDLPRVAMLDDMGPLTEILGAVPGREFVPFAERILGDLLDDRRFGGQLIETLYAYLQTSGSPREAGALLHLHPSTVKYRIRVIRELLGPRLEDRSTRFDLELAVRLCLAARLLKKAPG